jgi:hypothetical protein
MNKKEETNIGREQTTTAESRQKFREEKTKKVLIFKTCPTSRKKMGSSGKAECIPE